MKAKTSILMTTLILGVALASPAWLCAQHPRYKFIDLGTLGGPNSFSAAFSGAGAQLINNRGQAIGTSETSFSKLDYPNFTPNVQGGPDPYVLRPIVWRDHRATGLDAIRRGRNSAAPGWISDSGLIAGVSETGLSDQIAHAFFWQRGVLTDLVPFGGDVVEPFWPNDLGEVVGGADYLNDNVRHAFLKEGLVTDLKTVYPDCTATENGSVAISINSKSQVVAN